MVKQTAGRDSLGDFAPQFAQLNDDVLFGQVWNQEGLSLKLRSILTVTALVSKGLIDSSFQYHLTTAKQNGVTKSEMAAILTHLAFYAGWPNAWAAFRMAVEVYQDGDGADGGLFGLGAPNEAFAQYFIGNSYLKPLTHTAAKGGGQPHGLLAGKARHIAKRRKHRLGAVTALQKQSLRFLFMVHIPSPPESILPRLPQFCKVAQLTLGEITVY